MEFQLAMITTSLAIISLILCCIVFKLQDLIEVLQ
ncbi:hypothetical protein PBI_GAIA_96 [Mycobacterium phage Gaia]|uniref:Uncharacterized protein n=1 Tax=Mycobacterium phage Gaia TaxID=1486472 RepID=A0A068F8S7_9CAUD|nr:hypothetical protein VC46_gp137 [Mycobacterium phage Gaia]AID58915.1 hypothetical protein PBI_GAIA_96 [Mycobacterium phage Gaia]